jgi:RHS repeat-associated protein
MGERSIEKEQAELDAQKAGSSMADSVHVDYEKKGNLSKDALYAAYYASGRNGIPTAGNSGKIPYGQLKKYFNNTGNTGNGNNGNNGNGNSGKVENLQFFYHSDHLGSSNYITDASGEVYQHNEYFPYGETFVEQRNGTEYTAYLFSGKELDSETGLYYFGARYHDPKISVFFGVDPLMDKFPGISAYAYCANNPIKLIDPNGMDIYRYDDQTGEMIFYKSTTDNFDQIGEFKQDKKSGEYILQTDKKGNPKTRISNIECGILSNGMNFKFNDNIINVGGEGQASVVGFQNFITEFTDMVETEIGGYYLSNKTNWKINIIYIEQYQHNFKQWAVRKHRDFTSSEFGDNTVIRVDYHTHVTGFITSFQPSGLDDKNGNKHSDIRYKNNLQGKGAGYLFWIFVGNYRIDYTNMNNK